MPDPIVGSRYEDAVVGREFTVVGIYERTVRDDEGKITGTEVIVDCLYEGADDPTRVELDLFKGDAGIELIETPDWV